MSLFTKTNAAQEFVPIKEIRDGVVILKDDSLRMVLLASSINFALKSIDEQTGILLQFQETLNGLDFPIQIMVRSRRLDIRPYLGEMEEQLKSQTNELIKLQVREYIEFIKNFTESVDIMSKSFFIVIPYNTIITEQSGGIFSRVFGGKSSSQAEATMKQFLEHKTQLEERAQVIQQGLSRCGVRIAQLGTEELLELYFQLFNPGEQTIPKAGGSAVR